MDIWIYCQYFLEVNDNLYTAAYAQIPGRVTILKLQQFSYTRGYWPSRISSNAVCTLFRRILGSTEVNREEPGGDLRNVLAAEICRIMLRNLPEIIHKSHGLIPEGQVTLF